ncbi:MAG: hypothetical protein DMG86_23270 [Acidobacteria bacterium]|jgi:hypothetical protein|nr:MAG: hypothetical protein AUI85_08570 [Acidobacteriales bacterium 13_1_40CM_3_55_5]PYV94435.1 MAG: hypothetical protein DMG86_23270 [Acidobacteriota bacterium]PYX16077.1 MAG: hypothetical protein DMG84_09040 [Acidobacteriota bacterium]
MGGRTAKATVALGTLPYAHLMQQLTTRLRFFTQTTFRIYIKLLARILEQEMHSEFVIQFL